MPSLTMVAADFQKPVVAKPDKGHGALPDDTGAENNGLTPRRQARDLVDQACVVLARRIRDVDRASTDTSRCRVETTKIVIRLEHVPVWNHV